MTVEKSTNMLETIVDNDSSDNTDIDMAHKINQYHDGVFCCASMLCGKPKESTTYIEQSMICHRCCICSKAMHGSICGAEASTILLETECTSTLVICSLCIKNKGER